MLPRLHDAALTGGVTLCLGVAGSLRRRSFGILMRQPALVAIGPGAPIVAGGALMIPAVQMNVD